MSGELWELPSMWAEATRMVRESWAMCRPALQLAFGERHAIDTTHPGMLDPAIDEQVHALGDVTNPASFAVVARMCEQRLDWKDGYIVYELHNKPSRAAILDMLTEAKVVVPDDTPLDAPTALRLIALRVLA